MKMKSTLILIISNFPVQQRFFFKKISQGEASNSEDSLDILEDISGRQTRPLLQGTSLKIFSLSNRFRLICKSIVFHKYWDLIMAGIIFLSCVELAVLYCSIFPFDFSGGNSWIGSRQSLGNHSSRF